jgi:hypothetical protein
MKKSIVLLLMAVCAPFLVMAQNVVDDLYYVPTKANKEQAKAAEQKTEADAARKTVVVKSNKPATTIVVPEGTKVVVNGNTKNKRSVDEYNRRYTGDATASNKEAVVNGDTNYDGELDGEWVNGFDGNSDDYEYATRIIRFRNPRFAISISSPYYWDVVYGLNSWEWNVFVDDYYAYVFPTWSNRLWFDWRFSTVGWGWGWSSWYHPWYTSWYSPWYSPWHYGWYGGWYSPWYTGWYGGWYGGWHSPWHYGSYYGWGGYHYRPQNYTFRGQPGARSSYSNSTRRGGVGGNGVGVNNATRTRTANGTRVRSNDGTSVRSNGTRTRTTGNGRVVNSSNGTRVRTNATGTRSNTNVTPNANGTRVRSNNGGTNIQTRSGSTVRSSGSAGTTRTRTYSPSSTQSSRSYSPGSSSSTRVRSNSTSTPTRSSSPTRSYSGSSSSRSYSGGGYSGGGSRGGGFSGGGGGSRGGGGGGGRSR